MPKATQKQLEELHGSLAVAIKLALAGDEGAPPAAVLNTARQFLSDNNIEADITPGDPEEYLSDDDDFAPPADLDEPADCGDPDAFRGTREPAGKES
jgi:hypothetical protein